MIFAFFVQKKKIFVFYVTIKQRKLREYKSKKHEKTVTSSFMFTLFIYTQITHDLLVNGDVRNNC